MKAPTPLFLFFILAFQALAGCGEAPLQSDPRLLDLASCHEKFKSHCNSFSGGIRLHDLLLEGASGLGLTIEAGDQHVILENVTLLGFDVGIDVRSCRQCLLEIRNARIESNHQGIRIGDSVPAEGILLLTESSIGLGQATGTRGEVLTQGIRALDFQGSMHLTGVRLESIEPSSVAVWSLRTLDSVTVTDTSIAGFGRGLRGDWPNFTARGLQVNCIGDAISLEGVAHQVWLEDVQIAGCGGHLIAESDCLNGCGAPAIFVYGATQLGAGHLVARNLTVWNVAEGVLAQGLASITLEGFTLEAAGIGVNAVANQFHARDGTVRNVTGMGMLAQADSVLIERVKFTGNALPRDDFYAALIVRTPFLNNTVPLDRGIYATIRDCSFSGNGIALITNHTDGVVDAAYNWWGSPLGPSRLPGRGQEVYGAVLLEPHLLQEPSATGPPPGPLDRSHAQV